MSHGTTMGRGGSIRLGLYMPRCTDAADACDEEHDLICGDLCDIDVVGVLKDIPPWISDGDDFPAERRRGGREQ